MANQIDRLLSSVDFKPVDGAGPDGSGMPYATHSGVLNIPGFPVLRCYRLNDGRAIFNADDMKAWLHGLAME